MNVEKLGLDGLILIELDVRTDQRGFFIERYNEGRFKAIGLPPFCQDNHSRSAPRTLRGLHYQVRPAQGKLVGVIRGAIWDVVVDIRPGSPTFGRTLSLELNDRDGRVLWVPAGFAHGFCVLGSEAADVLYKVDTSYEPATEGGILWSDPELAIPWPVADPIISPKDQKLPAFARYRAEPPAWD
ncbi:MAG: dTDP-4-dehydrorhamnose 3,5-epimerase [Luteitalea sp.]|nr:dTDP-4-dehydrorhamnose 3,5-epimerase [Luteitalea sp.]